MYKKILLFTLSLVIALAIGDGALEVYYRLRSGKWLWEATAFQVGYVQPVPDRRQYALRPGYTDPKLGITINSLGFRGDVVPSRTERVIVALGDSVPFGWGAQDEATYPAQLDALLRQSGYPLRVLNAAVPSYNLRQAFDTLQFQVLEHYDAPMLVLVQAANDVTLLTHFREAYTPDVTWANIRFRSPEQPRLAMLHYLDIAMQVAQAQSGDPHSSRGERHEPFPEDRLIRGISDVLEEGSAFSAERSIRMVLLPIDPFYYQTSGIEKNASLSRMSQHEKEFALWDDLIRKYNDRLRDFADQHPNVFFFDTRAVLDKHDREHMYLDFIHYSPEGHRIVAQELLTFLRQQGLVQR